MQLSSSSATPAPRVLAPASAAEFGHRMDVDGRRITRSWPQAVLTRATHPARHPAVAPALRSLLYMSKIRPEMAMDDEALMEIVNPARARNAQAGITGALIITDLYFVQLVEGPDRAVSDLVSRLKRDPRHSDMTIVTDRIARHRSFGRWSLAYRGPDTFIDQQLLPLLKTPDAAGRQDIGHRLFTRLRLMADNEILETDRAA